MKGKSIRVLLAAVAWLFATVLSAQQLSEPAVKLLEPLSDAQVYDMTMPVFGGYMITPGPLYYNGHSFSVMSDWKYNSYEIVYGRKPGSTYFSFMDLGRYFDSRKDSFSLEDPIIDNCGERVRYGAFRDWRLPTEADWRVILGTGREGAYVNGRSHVCYATVVLSGVRYAGMKNPLGLLLFPDGLVLPDCKLVLVDTSPVTYEMMAEDLNTCLEKGCVFLPASGQYFVDRLYWYFGGVHGVYHSSESLSEQYGAAIQFGTHEPKRVDARKVYHFYMTRLVRKVTLGSVLEKGEELQLF